jgi:hypothetical protein
MVSTFEGEKTLPLTCRNAASWGLCSQEKRNDCGLSQPEPQTSAFPCNPASDSLGFEDHSE